MLARRSLLALVALVAWSSACAPASSGGAAPAPLARTTASAGRGTLFIVGGGPQPAALVREFVDLAGGSGRARIVVFAMASESGATSGEEKAKDLRDLGATARNIWVDSSQADTDSIAALVADATGVWFGGGDQNRLTRALRGTRTERMIKQRYAAGAVIGGTSAGAAVMSAQMITGDERHPGGDRPPRDSSDAWMTIARDNVVLGPGFALLDNAIVDQHFMRRKRHNRLISLVLEQPVRLGVGIDESTALVVESDGRWRVAGASAAVVYDARRSTTTAATRALGATGIVMHVLPAGSRFDPASGIATLPAP
jgi:cyanophycinase